jgi:hypothetical protein
VTQPIAIPGFESPSLVVLGGVPAFELKFLLEEARAREVEAWARRHLATDPHGDPVLGGAYRTTSLYCDTPELDVYHRAEAYKTQKFRVRCYGSMAWAFLERKAKQDDRVAKRRTPVPAEDLALLAHVEVPAGWTGRWFHRNLQAYRLLPACLVLYQRTAYAGWGPEGPLRLTLDRHVQGRLANQWSLGPGEGARPLLAGQIILELKFRIALPAPFQALVRDLHLCPGIVSKYRLCREAWGAPAAARDAMEA